MPRGCLKLERLEDLIEFWWLRKSHDCRVDGGVPSGDTTPCRITGVTSHSHVRYRVTSLIINCPLPRTTVGP